MKHFFTLMMIIFATASFAQVDGNNGTTRDQRTTGIQQIDYDANVSVYAVDGQLVLVSSLSQAFETIDVFNIQGSLMTSRVANSTQESIDVSGYIPGVYFVQARIDGEMVVKKVFISGR